MSAQAMDCMVNVIIHKIYINIWLYCGKCKNLLHFAGETVYNFKRS